jgi:CubicO group peptidase (beta-lactamase class C family)
MSTETPSAGVVADPYRPVEAAFRRLMARGGGGGALVVRQRGRTVVNLCAGHADRRATRPWTPETLAISFSTTKGIASTLVHLLIDRGIIDLDRPVAAYWAAFAAGGKDRVTVRQLMTHRAGLHSVVAVANRAEDLLDHEMMEARLAARTVQAPTARSAYHAITYGWLISGLLRAVTGHGLRDLVAAELAGPLGIDGLHIGAPAEAEERVAEPVGTALRKLGATVELMRPVWSRSAATRTALEALLVPGFHRLFEGRRPPIWTAEMPAVNGTFSAQALARLYGFLANGGADGERRLLSHHTVDELGRVQVRTADAVLRLRMRWRVGYHQAFAMGPIAPRAFGHYGFGGSGGWADPTLGLSVGFVTNCIGSLSTPMGDLTLFRINRVVRECAARAGRL